MCDLLFVMLCFPSFPWWWRGFNSCDFHRTEADPPSVRAATFYRLSACSWTTLVLKQCANTHSKGAPSSLVFIPHIRHPLSSDASAPLLLLADLHPHSPPAWPSMATTFTRFFFKTHRTCLRFTESVPVVVVVVLRCLCFHSLCERKKKKKKISLDSEGAKKILRINQPSRPTFTRFLVSPF